MGITSVRVPDNSLDVLPKRVTIAGTYECLSERDAFGPQTEECASGLVTDDGARYAVNFSPAADATAAFQSEVHIVAEGFIVEDENIDADRWRKYDLQGRFTITKILSLSDTDTDSLIQKNMTTLKKDPVTSFKHCAAGMTWICGPVSQGMEFDPRHPPAEVCGCGPVRCLVGDHRITNFENGTWPDGTNHGSFVCSSEDPPTAELPPSR
jgi:hypothetical protein